MWVARCRKQSCGERFRSCGIFLHGDGIHGIPIALPFADYRMVGFETLESGCTGLVVAFDGWVDFHSKGPTELSGRPEDR